MIDYLNIMSVMLCHFLSMMCSAKESTCVGVGVTEVYSYSSGSDVLHPYLTPMCMSCLFGRYALC